MRNRWFHLPKLHSPAPGLERKVGWLELFYDLVFVATLIQLGNALSHNVSVMGFLAFAAIFVPVWSAWSGFTFFENRFIVDDFIHRFLVFGQMFSIGAMAINIGGVLDGNPVPFALSYASVRFFLAALYFRSYLQVKEARQLSRRWLFTYGIEACLWTASAFVDPPWTYALWGLGIITNFSVPFSRSARELAGAHPPDLGHLSERFGLFTLIVLGESFVKMLSSLSEDPTGSIMMAAFALIVTCSLWWIYFDDVAGSRIRKRTGSLFIWIYTHLPLTLAITAVGVGAKKVVYFEPTQVAPAGYRWLFAGSLGLALLATGLIDWVTERRQAELSDSARVVSRVASASFILVLIPAGAFMSSALFVGLLATVLFAQVILDLYIAPHKETEEAEHESMEQDEDDEDDVAPGDRPRRDVSEAYRRGTPNELRRDFYFFFMEGSWARLILAFIFVYLFINVAFASLYMLEPDSVANISSESFSDAFFFSVQTISTIGYGAMSPISSYGHMLVTIEAIIGVILIALMTGMVFAKASRPHSSVLFSKRLVVTKKDGQHMLMLRLGNGRGNDVVDAAITVSVLVDTVSPEGHKMRRFESLTLVRSSSPLFTLTWTVMHVIDETSPLWQVDWNSPECNIFNIIAIMTGHDSTYAQTTHARNVYYPENIRHGHRFVDIISNLPDGRLMVDYTKFHKTVPDEAAEDDDIDTKAGGPA